MARSLLLAFLLALPLIALPGAQSVRAAHMSTVRIYLIAIGTGRAGKTVGCGDGLVAVTRPIAPTRAPLSTAIRLLLNDHHRYYGQSGLYNALYRSRLRLVSASIKGGHARVRLAGRLNLGGECDDPRVAAQLRHTALQFRTVTSVSFTVNGKRLDCVLGGRGCA
jgi:spore germination protein GerM